MCRDEVGRVLRLVDLEHKDSDIDNNKGRGEKGGTAMTPSTTKNATRIDKNKSATTMAMEKKKNKKNPHK